MDEVLSMLTGKNWYSQMKKGWLLKANPFEDLVELRGIEPLTPRLPALCSPS